MLIGKLAAVSGFSRDTIRYYEKLGLLHVGMNARRDNNYKDYSPRVLERLIQIRQLKGLGFTLSEIADLLGALAQADSPCADLPAQLDKKILLIEEKISLLTKYKSKLTVVRQACDGECGQVAGLPECFAPRCC